MNKNKTSISRRPLYRENLFSAKKKRQTPIRENFTILPIKHDTSREKMYKVGLIFFFLPIQKLDNRGKSGIHGHFQFSSEKYHRSDLTKFLMVLKSDCSDKNNFYNSASDIVLRWCSD